MARAKDLNGLLTLIADATRTCNSTIRVLAPRKDVDSQCQLRDMRDMRDNLEMIGRDLTNGLIDLRELPFDEEAWVTHFTPSGLQLEAEPEPEPRPTPPAPDVDRSLFGDSAPEDYGLGIPPDLLEGIPTDEIPYDDAPTVPILDV